MNIEQAEDDVREHYCGPELDKVEDPDEGRLG